jgi:aldehyde dehydrogenase (NAD+)
LVEAISTELGAPLAFARERHVPAGLGHLTRTVEVLRTYEFDETINSTLITREPIGVVGLITPWNWPLNQIACKVGPALAAGCTMVLKPSEVAPLSALIFAEILNEAGVPAGVFNLINGDGPSVGQALASHPDVDMVSFTGSTRAGILVAKAAADTVKRVHQELGGKSPDILLDDADFETAVTHGAQACFANSGQSCNAPTRLLVPADWQEEVIAMARRIAEETVVGDPRAASTTIGPVVSQIQFERIQTLIEVGIKEGATLVAGGLGRPAGLNRGYYVQPTVFANVRNDMRIAQEEIFGPVLSILPYKDEEDAICMANGHDLRSVELRHLQ